MNPQPLGHEAASLFAIRAGFLDAVPVANVSEFLETLLDRLDTLDRDVLEALEKEEEFPAAMEARLRLAIEATQRAIPTE